MENKIKLIEKLMQHTIALKPGPILFRYYEIHKEALDLDNKFISHKEFIELRESEATSNVLNTLKVAYCEALMENEENFRTYTD